MSVMMMYSRSPEREGSNIKHSMSASKAKSSARSKSMGKKKEKKAPKEKSQRSAVPLAFTRSMKTGVPQVSGSPYSSDGRVRIHHREFIQDVDGSVAFSALSLPINPGMKSVFPWLSIMANQFESYLFRSIKFEYETQKSASTSGSVMLAVDFDAADATPVDKQQLMSYHNAVRSAVWAECCYSSDKRDLQKFGVQRYIRNSSLAANLDIKTYDVGNVILATQGESDSSVIGELYVEYDVELITPQAQAESSCLSAWSLSKCVPTDANLLASGVPDPLNAGWVTYDGANLLTFSEPGEYHISFYMKGSLPVGHGGTVSAGSSSLAQWDAIGLGEITKFIQLSMIANGTLLLDDTIGVGENGAICISRLPKAFGAVVVS